MNKEKRKNSDVLNKYLDFSKSSKEHVIDSFKNISDE